MHEFKFWRAWIDSWWFTMIHDDSYILTIKCYLFDLFKRRTVIHWNNIKLRYFIGNLTVISLYWQRNNTFMGSFCCLCSPSAHDLQGILGFSWHFACIVLLPYNQNQDPLLLGVNVQTRGVGPSGGGKGRIGIKICTQHNWSSLCA